MLRCTLPTLLIVLLAAPVRAQDERAKTTVAFEVDCARALEGDVKVTMTVERVTAKDVTVSMPVWAPGSYRYQNFQKNVSNVASRQGKVEVIDDKTWKVASGGAETVTVTYDVKVNRGNFGDTWYDCIGPATFMYVVGHKDAPQSCVFKMPAGWKALNGLEQRDGAWIGRDYDTFIDQPTMLGFFEVLEFNEMGTLYQLACCGPIRDANDFGIAFEANSLKAKSLVSGGPAEKAGLKEGDVITSAGGQPVKGVKDLGRQAWSLFREEKLEVEVDRGGKAEKLTLVLSARIDAERLKDCHQKLVRPAVKMYGGKAPFDRYVFLIYFNNSMGGGGLEHLFSCHINFSFQAVRRDPYTIASLDSHEFVHAWNVKRIRPFELGPFDYTKAVPSKHLWLSEGVTSYYGDLGLARAKIWDESRYFSHLTMTMETVDGNPDRKRRSVEDFSENVWTKPTAYYYDKGEILGMLLDLQIRAATKNEKSFDDVMRHLYKTYVTDPAAQGKGWIGVGFPRDGILKAINTVSGKDFGGFYEKYISGTEELPYEETFSAVGLAFSRATKVNDLGVPLRGRVIGPVEKGSDAEKAGFKQGDRIAAINGEKVDGISWRDVLNKLEPGKEVKVTVERGNPAESVELKAKVALRDRPGYTLKRAEKQTELQKKIVDSWLGCEEY